MPDDKTDVLTSQHIESLNAVVKHAEKALKVLETKSKQKIEYFEDSYADLTKKKDTLEGRIDKIKEGVARLPRTDPSFLGLVKDLSVFAKEVEAESKKQPVLTYYFGKAKVGNPAALEAKVKGELPAPSKGNASQAVNDAVAGKGKDAAKAGSGVKHASSGVKGVSSATVFFTHEEVNKGLETILTIVGVGSHKGGSSYDIHWSSTSKLKEGSVFEL